MVDLNKAKEIAKDFKQLSMDLEIDMLGVSELNKAFKQASDLIFDLIKDNTELSKIVERYSEIDENELVSLYER